MKAFDLPGERNNCGISRKVVSFLPMEYLDKEIFSPESKGLGFQKSQQSVSPVFEFLAWTGKEEIQREGGNSGDLVGEEDFSRAWKKRHLGWLGQFPHLEFSNNTINLTIKTIKFESEKKKFESEKK